MSADNGIYILQTSNEWRVVHAQAIENIYWWRVDDKYPYQWEQRKEINPFILYQYFKSSRIFYTPADALYEAMRIYKDIMADSFCPIIEYGICEINGSTIQFPKEQPACCDNPILTQLGANDGERQCENCGEYL